LSQDKEKIPRAQRQRDKLPKENKCEAKRPREERGEGGSKVFIESTEGTSHPSVNVLKLESANR